MTSNNVNRSFAEALLRLKRDTENFKQLNSILLINKQKYTLLT